MADPLVKVIDVNKMINKQRIVEQINLSIDAADIVGLCGGNGAGKSTILRMIAGIIQPSSGEIHVNGLQWKRDRRRFAEQIGYMPDDYQFPQGLTAQEMLSFWAALRRVPEERVGEVLAIVGLEDRKNKPVSTFSKGMRQRVLFAQAILAKPPLLIMDEPTNGLDPYWTSEFVKLLRHIKQEGQTVLFSTHQLEIAEEIADSVVFLNAGQSCGGGTLRQLRETYGKYPLHAAFQDSLGIKPITRSPFRC